MQGRLWNLTTIFNYIIVRMRFQTHNLVEMNKMGLWFHVICNVLLYQCMFSILIKLPFAFQKEILTGKPWSLFLASLATDCSGDWRLVPAV